MSNLTLFRIYRWFRLRRRMTMHELEWYKWNQLCQLAERELERRLTCVT